MGIGVGLIVPGPSVRCSALVERPLCFLVRREVRHVGNAGRRARCHASAADTRGAVEACNFVVKLTVVLDVVVLRASAILITTNGDIRSGLGVALEVVAP